MVRRVDRGEVPTLPASASPSPPPPRPPRLRLALPPSPPASARPLPPTRPPSPPAALRRKRFRTPRVYALHGTALELADELARHPAVPLADARLNGDAAEAQLHVLRERHAQLALSTGAANRALLRQVDEAV